jgi:hypothetical protein
VLLLSKLHIPYARLLDNPFNVCASRNSNSYALTHLLYSLHHLCAFPACSCAAGVRLLWQGSALSFQSQTKASMNSALETSTLHVCARRCAAGVRLLWQSVPGQVERQGRCSEGASRMSKTPRSSACSATSAYWAAGCASGTAAAAALQGGSVTWKCLLSMGSACYAPWSTHSRSEALLGSSLLLACVICVCNMSVTCL